MARRWQQLPLGHAASAEPLLRRTIVSLLGAEPPELGPATSLDQLRVAVWDACARDRDGDRSTVLDALVELRRTLP